MDSSQQPTARTERSSPLVPGAEGPGTPLLAVADGDGATAVPSSQHRDRALLLTAAANIGTTVFGSLGGLLLARVLGPTTRGHLAVVVLWPTVIGSLAIVSLPQAACYFVASSDSRRHGSLVATATSIALALGSLVAVAGYLASPLITDEAEVRRWLRVLFLLQPLALAAGAWSGSLQALDIVRWNIARAVQPLGYFLAVVTLAGLGRLSLGSASASLVVCVSVQGAVSGALLATKCRFWRAPDWRHCRPVLGYGLRSTTAGAPWLLNSRLDQLLLSLLVPSAVLGNYVVAVSLSQLALPVSTAVGSVSFPRIARAKTVAKRRCIQRHALIWASATAAAVIAPLAIASPWFIPGIFGRGYSAAVLAFWLLAPGAAIYSVNYVAQDLLRGWGRPLDAGLAEGSGALATVVFLLVFVPRWGINGAAIASTLAYGIVAALLIRALRRCSKGPARD